MERRIASGIMMTLLLIGMLTLAFDIQPVKASGTIYIRADGSTDPPTVPIASESFGTSELMPILDTFTTVMEQNTTWWDAGGISGPFVLYDSGKYKMWYGATPTDYSKVICYAESSDGILWTNKTLVHDFGLQDPYYWTGEPWVMKEGGVYRMWHMDYYEWVAGDWSSYISHMVSIDGVNWVNETKVLSALGQSNTQGDGYRASAPCILYEPGVGYVMWYSVLDHYQPGMPGPQKIWQATSDDGITWSSRQLSLPYVPDTWEGNVAHSSVLTRGDGTYTMFYGACYTNGSYPSLGIAKSIDGVSWTNRTQLLRPSDLGANITGLGHPFNFKDVDGNRHLYFSYYDKGDGKWKFGRIQLGLGAEYFIKLSSDVPGSNWGRTLYLQSNYTDPRLGDLNIVLLNTSQLNGHATRWIQDATLLYDEENSVYKMWVVAMTGDPYSYWSVYYMESDSLLDWSAKNIQECYYGVADALGVTRQDSISVLKESNSSYKMWFQVYQADGWKTQIWYRSSTDGITWTEPQLVIGAVDLDDWGMPTALHLANSSNDRLYYHYNYQDVYDFLYLYRADLETDGTTTWNVTQIAEMPHGYWGLLGATIIGNQDGDNHHRIWFTQRIGPPPGTGQIELLKFDSFDEGQNWNVTNMGTYDTTNYAIVMTFYAFRPPVHDVAITNVAPSRTVVDQGYSLNINVTAANQGDYTETFNVTTYCNKTIPVRSSPAIAMDGTIYVGSDDGKVYAINPDGTLKWNYTTGGVVESSPAIGSDGTVYVGSADDKVYAINPNGTLKWNYTTVSDVYSSPTIDPSSGIIYVASYRDALGHGRMYAFYPNGTLVPGWPFDPGTSGSWITASPAIREDGVILFGDWTNPKGIFWALNPNGTVLWQRTIPCPFGEIDISSAAIGSDGMIYFGGGNTNRELWALYPNGTIAWSYLTGGLVTSSPAIATDGTIYVGSWDYKLHAVHKNGTGKWTFTTGHRILSSPAIGADGTIYVGSDDCKVYAINPDGTLKWNYTTGAEVMSSPAIGSDGTIYIGSYDGKLYALGPEEVGVDWWPMFRHDPKHTGRSTVVGAQQADLKWRFTTNGIIIQTKTVTNLPSGEQTTITFTWNTTGVAKGSYTISAYAWPVLGETDTTGNTLIDGIVIVTYVGDFDADFDVDYDDIIYFVDAYIKYWSGQGKDPLCDFDNDCDIDYDDILIFVSAYIDYWTPP